MSRIEVREGQPIYWFDGKTPKRKRKGKNGVPINEKLPAPPWRYCVKPSGHVIPLTLTSAAADRNVHGPAANNRRTKKIEQEGFIWADECPIATGRMPADLKKPDDQPCQGYTNEDGRAIQGPRDQVCRHVARLIQARTAEHAEHARDWNERFKTEGNRMLEVLLRREERELERETVRPRGKGKADGE